MPRSVALVLGLVCAVTATAQTPPAETSPAAVAALRQRIVAEQSIWLGLAAKRDTSLAQLDPVREAASTRRRLLRLLANADELVTNTVAAARNDETTDETWTDLAQRFPPLIVRLAKLQVKLSKVENPPRPTPGWAATPLPESATLQRVAWMATLPSSQAAWGALHRMATSGPDGLQQAETLANRLEAARQKRIAVAAAARSEDALQQKQAVEAEIAAIIAEIASAAPTPVVPDPTPPPSYDFSSLRAFVHATRESLKSFTELTRAIAKK